MWIRLSAAVILIALATTTGVLLWRSGESSNPAPRLDAAGAAMGLSFPAPLDEGLAPDFELRTIDGEPFRLYDHHGKVVALNFWATWCAPCRIEIPHFIEMQEDLRTEGMLFVGISLDHEGEEIVQDFARELGINYPVMIDDGSVMDEYGGIYALPTTILVDRRGHVMRRIPGLVTSDVLMPILEDLLAGG